MVVGPVVDRIRGQVKEVRLSLTITEVLSVPALKANAPDARWNVFRKCRSCPIVRFEQAKPKHSPRVHCFCQQRRRSKKFRHKAGKQQKSRELINAKTKIYYGLFEGKIMRLCESRELLCYSMVDAKNKSNYTTKLFHFVEKKESGPWIKVWTMNIN